MFWNTEYFWKIYEILTKRTQQQKCHRRQTLDAIESSAKENDNSAIDVVSTENVDGKSSSLKKVEEVKKKGLIFFVSLLITLGH